MVGDDIIAFAILLFGERAEAVGFVVPGVGVFPIGFACGCAVMVNRRFLYQPVAIPLIGAAFAYWLVLTG